MLNNLNVFPISSILYFIYEIYSYLFTINIFNFLNKKEIDDKFIYIEKNSLSRDFCNEIIFKFENDERRSEGVVSKGLDRNVKFTTDLVITKLPEWNSIDEILCDALSNALKKYLFTTILVNGNDNRPLVIISQIINTTRRIDNDKGDYSITDFGYQIQKYDKNTGFYVWHNDFVVDDTGRMRYFTFIWYLNDVDVGGQTEFLYGKIKPEAGKLLLFPATWTYVHRGIMPVSNNKYILTGWVGYDFNV
jgi:hypothetical protein